MSERGLVVHQGALSTIETALAQASTDIGEQVTDLLDQVVALTPGWDPTSDSYAAHRDHQQKLRDGIARLTAALDELRAKLATCREDARETEVENVALVN